MNCKRYQRFIVESIVGEIGKRDKENLDAHLKICSDCRRTFIHYESILNKSKEIETSIPDDIFWANRLKDIYQLPEKKNFRLVPVFALTVSIICFIILNIVLTPLGGKIFTKNKKKDAFVFNTLPMSEERLLEMADYIDEKSAIDILDIIFDNNIPYVVNSNN
ncbi:zf-HC2 domain-containing protein [bacterium]|nr:zf-HC2 domain-containing protein [bacterium]